MVVYGEKVERVGHLYGYDDTTAIFDAQSATITLNGKTSVVTLASGTVVMTACRFGWTTAMPCLLLIASTSVLIPENSISTQASEPSEGQWLAGVSRLFCSIVMLMLVGTGALLAAAFTGSSVKELFLREK